MFWIMDNGSSHRGKAVVRRLTETYPRPVPVHRPVHASRLNPTGITFPTVPRKALMPNDFPSREAVGERLYGFERSYEGPAHPLRLELRLSRPAPRGLPDTLFASRRQAPGACGPEIHVRIYEVG